MHLDIIATIIVTATIQSLLGVGVLLFGTPILLVIGYEFLTALTVLLPISMTINAIQVSRHVRQVDGAFFRKILLFSLPGIVLCLLLVSRVKINIELVVGVFLIVVALKSVWPWAEGLLNSLMRFERSYFVVMGIVHGMTNLGGSLLTALVYSKNFGKDATRVTVAASYGMFALLQLVTLVITLNQFPFVPSEIGLFTIIGVAVFVLTEIFLYSRLNIERYRVIFAVFLLVAGVVIMLRNPMNYCFLQEKVFFPIVRVLNFQNFS